MNVECAVWDVERGGGDWCAPPPPTNPVNSQLPTNLPVLTHSTLESTAKDLLVQDYLHPRSTSHTQPIHHHVSSRRDGLRG